MPASLRPWLFTLLCLLVPGQVSAFTDEDIDELLDLPEPPGGVVFEIVEGQLWALVDVIPQIRAAIERIRAKYPKTEFAVVSHGREQFALQSKYDEKYAVIHEQAQALVSDDVPLHVCETHASWMGVTVEDFPDYVNVAPTGPGQVNLYRDLGYHLIVVE